MRISKIKITGFGKFSDKDITFTDNMNLVFGKNEAGKSTIQNFIKASLYGFENQRTDGEGRPSEKNKYRPWNSGSYSGYMELTSDEGKKLRVERDFENNETHVFDNNLTDITNDFEYRARSGLRVGENLLGIDRNCFENSVFIGQGSTAVAQNDRNHLFEKIVNLMNTGTEDESAAKALLAISTAKRNLGTSRTHDRPYNQAMVEVDSLEKKFSLSQQRNSEMSSNMERKKFLEREDILLSEKISLAESALQADKLTERKTELEKTKRRHLSLLDEINSLDKEIYNDKNKHAKLNITGQREQDVLTYMQKAASSTEKQKRIPDGNHSLNLKNLEKKNAQKKTIILVMIALIIATVPLGFLVSPFIFIATAILSLAFIYVFLKKSPFSIEQLKNNIELEKECNSDLSEINDFLSQSGKSTTTDFDEAQSKLRTLYDEIIEKTSLTGVINNKEARKSGQESLAGEILGTFRSLAELDTELSAISTQLERIGPATKSGGKSLDELKNDHRKAREELAGIKRLLDEYTSDEEELADILERLDAAKESLSNINLEQKALDLSEKLIKSASESLRGNIFPVINEKMGTLLSRITNGRHTQLLAGLGKTMNTEFNDNARTIWNFSDGTIDQMYLCLRLAATEAMSENESLPVFIDEAFAYYDEDRINAAFELLFEASESRQIIVFTCKESELEIAKKHKDINIIEL